MIGTTDILFRVLENIVDTGRFFLRFFKLMTEEF